MFVNSCAFLAFHVVNDNEARLFPMTRISSVRTGNHNPNTADYAALATENDRLLAALAAEAAERQKFYTEMETARSVQERIFPTVRPAISGLDYFADWRPARAVSGDYIDYFEMNGGNLGLAVGDVCGKGVSAALLTSSLHSLVRALRFARTPSLRVLVRTIDKLFAEVCPDNCYATLFVSEYDPDSGQLHYVNAGHEPPFVLRKSGSHFQTEFLESGGPVIGMLHDASYREGVISLRPGDLLVAYTDGLYETANASGEEWGWPRLQETVEACADEPARDIVEGVLECSEAFASGTPRRDDVTLWVGHVQDAVAETPRWRSESVAELVAA
jgi:sigma-B regulation protein RsbU (phosphoserine phosphatase)